MKMLPLAQDPKYGIIVNAADDTVDLVNLESKEIIPRNEPVFIMRAKDKNTALTIAFYKKICANPLHKHIVNKRLHNFVDFAHSHPEIIEEPDTGKDPS